jgi:hypothetical protein
VPKVAGSPKSDAADVEHGAEAAQPVLAAFGSQSWMPLAPQLAWQAEEVGVPEVAQQTLPFGQLAAPAHCNAVAFPPVPPPLPAPPLSAPAAPGQIEPATQA